MPKIILRQDAITKGLKRYFTGKVCRNKHVSERYTASMMCIKCTSEQVKKWVGDNKERSKEHFRRGRKKYRETKKGQETIKKITRINIESGKHKIASNKYFKSEKGKNTYNNWRRDQRKNNPQFKIIENTRNRLNNFLKTKKMIKSNSTFKIVGCTPEKLRTHLKKQFLPGMSWKNYSLKGWHIDHKVPLASAKTIEDVEKLMHYSNLQPLWAIDNMEKGAKY